MLHHYVVTEPVEEIKQLDYELPVIRDPYSSCYLRQEQNGILVGIYETTGSKGCLEDISWDFESELLPDELERLEPWLLKACERFPLFGEYGIRRTVAGAITHTPDGNFLAGPFGPMLLGDLGADVIKLEATRGDPMRYGAERSFAGCQRGKRSIALNLKDPRSRSVLGQGSRLRVRRSCALVPRAAYSPP